MNPSSSSSSSSSQVKCKCGQTFTEETFSRHFKSCSDFKSSFKQFDISLGELLKKYSEPKENLIIIRILLKQYISVLESKIKSSNIKDPSPPPKVMSSQNLPPQPVYQDNSSNNNNSSNDLNECVKCRNPEYTYLECFHPLCKNCIFNMAKTNFGNVRCPHCDAHVHEEYMKLILGNDMYNKLEQDALQNLIGRVVTCPNCKEQNPFEPGKVDYNVVDNNNKKLSHTAAEHYAKNRCRCPNCAINFCIECQTNPYHIGFTCAEYKRRLQALKCRYCDTEITHDNQGPDVDVCKKGDCMERFKSSCKKKLPCGHKCFGCADEKKCVPCLDQECPSYQNIYDQNKDEFCNICFCEGLGAAPVVMLSCKHLVHYHCIKARLEKKWIGPKITFNHCLCPVCNNWYDCSSNPIIEKLLIDNKTLYKDISDMAIKRLKFEDLDKDPKLTDPNSKWYGKNLEYALNRLSYYMCFKCKKPYFAGRRECGDGPNVNNDNPNRQYNPEDCICGKCTNLSGVAGVTNCKLHGKDFIEYKCKFCCKIASWFCWGTTHFCEDCHKRQCAGDYVSKYTKDKLPKCDPRKCELKVKHPPNGEEFALGCSVCRNMEANQKEF